MENFNNELKTKQDVVNGIMILLFEENAHGRLYDM